MPRPGPALALLVVLAALAAASVTVSAEHGDAPSARLNVLMYHPYPDLVGYSGGEGDPFGVPDPERPGWDRMFARYNASWFPTVRVDGVLEHEQPRGETASSVDRLRDAYAELVDARLRFDSPVTVTVDGEVNATRGTATATFTPKVDVASERVDLYLVVFEDNIFFEGANGIDVHRWTVRHVAAPEPVVLRAGEPVTVTRTFDVDANWTRDELGVVAFAQNRDPASVHAEDMEILQSAAHAFTAGEPTVQAEKVPLVEMYTATWCQPCYHGDLAVEELHALYAHGAPETGPRWEYLRAPTPAQAAAGAVAAAALGVALWPRRRGER